MTPLVICADDFGYDAAVDDGIGALVDAGRVTATSCLVLSPHWSEGAPRARALRGKADVGLHLDLTEFPQPASLPGLLVAGRLGLLRAARVRERVASQLSRFEDTVGAPPDYVDGHQHVHQLPAVARALVDELRRRYGNALPWMRVSQPAVQDLKGRIIAATGASGLRRRLDAAGIRHNARLLGIYDFGPSPPWLEHAAKWLHDARAGDALMVHPASGPVAGDPLADARQREFQALGSAEFQALLVRQGLAPARGSTLAAPSAAA